MAAGNIDLDGKTFQVEGTAWMDHEFFSDATDATESGWDWVSLQLDDRSEVMLYRLRHRDGSVDPYSSGSYIDAQGNCTFLSLNDFTHDSRRRHMDEPADQGHLSHPMACGNSAPGF